MRIYTGKLGVFAECCFISNNERNFMETCEENVHNPKKPFDFRDFGNLDHSEDAAYLIDSMDRMFSLETIRTIKRRAIDLLALKQGDTVIELGCGLAHDSEAIGQLVGKQGAVIALDSSALMLDEAKKRSLQPHIHYQLANAEKLAFQDNTFSAGYADRLLVSQRDVKKVLGELVRVVKPNGRICITDIDLGSVVMYPYIDELTKKLIERLQEIVLNKFIGRELPFLFKLFNLKDIQVYPEAYLVRSFELVNTMINFPRMIEDLQTMGRFTEEQAKRLLHALLSADERGDFIYGITLFTVAGVKS